MSRRSRAVARGLAAVLALAAVSLTLLVPAGASGPSLRSGAVTVVPAPAATRATWRWNARCYLVPVAGAGCRKAGPILGYSQLNGDPWNLGGPANAGAVEMSVASNGVAITGDFAHTPPCTHPACLATSANTWVRGYPNVLYGLNQCNADTSPRSSPRLPLPVRLDAIPAHLVGVTSYSSKAAATYDVTYDLWLNPTGTERPCRTSGTIEILIMTDYSARALPPESLRVGTAEIPFAVGRAVRRSAQPWSVYAANIGGNGWTAAWGGTLWFVPARADVVRRGRVSVDLSAVFAAAGGLLRDYYHWPEVADRYWLDTVAFGIEFGPPSGNAYDSGPSRFSARISSFCLAVRATLLNSGCE